MSGNKSFYTLGVFSDRISKLDLSILKSESHDECVNDDCDRDVVLIRGTKLDFLMLSMLFCELSEGKTRDIQISPTGAGSVHFSRNSKFGLYCSIVDDT